MSDRRFLSADDMSGGQAHRLLTNAWLRPKPNATPDRQCLWGDALQVLNSHGEDASVYRKKDGYAGWVRQSDLGPNFEPTHFVSVRTTWAWSAPDFKTEPLFDLHLNASVKVTSKNEIWFEIQNGTSTAYLSAAHCADVNEPFADPIAAARLYLGTPYVWAGNSGFGIDCSGLVQEAFQAAGRHCAADSDLQEAMPGQPIDTAGPFQPGDLIFWRRHVGLVTDANQMIHANAHHMAVVEEPIEKAMERIAATETGRASSALRPI